MLIRLPVQFKLSVVVPISLEIIGFEPPPSEEISESLDRSGREYDGIA